MNKFLVSGRSAEQAIIPDPTPMGPINYINSEIPEIQRPEYPGKYYDALVPATLDLAELGRLAINAFDGMLNPNCDYELYMGISHNADTPVMFHMQHDLQTLGEYFETFPQIRIMCGSKQGLDAEYGLMKVFLKMQGPDGMIYLPTGGRPWTLPEKSDLNSGLPNNESGIKQIASLGYGNARVISGFLMYNQKDPSGPWREAARRLVSGFDRILIKEGNIAYPFDAWTTPERPVEKPEKDSRGVCGGQGAWIALEFVRYDRAVGDPEATELALKMMRYTMEEMNYITRDGIYVHDGPPMGNRAHFFTHNMQFLAALYIIEQSGNKELLYQTLKAYDYSIREGNWQTGYFPESVCHQLVNETYGDPAGYHFYPVEIDEVTSMLMSALMLCRLGYDKWDDVDRWTRNQLVESQLTWTGWLTDGRREACSWWKKPKPFTPQNPLPQAYTTDRVLERTVGGFSTHASANDWLGMPLWGDTIFNCCTAAGARALYCVWRDVLTYDEGTLKINLLFNRASKWADVDSYIPYTGRVDVKIKQDLDLEIRIPEWVLPKQVSCEVDGKAFPLTFNGRYAKVGSVKKGQVASLNFPIFERTEKVNIQGTDYLIVRRGNDVVYMDPPGRYCPFYQRNYYRSSEPRYLKVTRFVSDENFDWW